MSTEQNGLWEVNIRTHELKQLISMKSDKGKYVHNILRNGNEIWAATEDGLYVYEMLTHELKHFKYEPTNPFSISDNALQCLFRDRDGGMWLGSYFGGCYYAPNYSYLFDKFIPMIDVPNSLHGRHVREMVEDRLGQIWIGTEDGGLNKYNPHTNQFSHIQISNDFSNIHGMCLMGDELWVGTFAYGLRVINIATGKLMKTYNTTTHPARLYDNNVFSLCNANGRIYVGLLSGLYIYDRNSKTFKRVGGLPQNIVYDIMNDRNGNLWVSIDGEGVYKWSDANHRWTKYTTQNQRITSDNVLCIFNSSNGQIWASTEGKGVCRYNTRTDRFEKVDIPKYQPRRVVYQILEDHNGRLWLTSNDGLICYNPSTQESKIFTVANGLLENSFNYNSSLLSSDGRIYLGSLNGFVSFQPGAMREVNTKPNIVATEFFLNNTPVGPQTKDSPLKQSITLTKRIELPNNANSFSLALAVLPYNNLQQFQLEYKLEGLTPGSHLRYHNVFGYNMVKATREGILAANPDKRPFVLSRSNFLGGQRYAATWTGDNVSAWEHMEKSIPMSLNMGLSGQPFNGPDIGGFLGNCNAELLAHWTVIGVYFPFVRNHCVMGAANQEPWAFGPKVEAVCRTAINRRYRLLPYIYTLFREANETGLPVMRPVLMADVKDTALRTEQQAFLLGGDVLVVPRWAKNVHLPKGDWDLFRFESKDDGYQPFLALRSGSIIPVSNVIQNTDEYSTDSLTFLVNPTIEGVAQGKFYADAGNGFGYRNGDYAQFELKASTMNGKITLQINQTAGQRKETVKFIRLVIVCNGKITYSDWTKDTKVILKAVNDKENGLDVKRLKWAHVDMTKQPKLAEQL